MFMEKFDWIVKENQFKITPKQLEERQKDSEMISFLSDRATKNLKASYFFLSFSDFPFIGDISPDFTTFEETLLSREGVENLIVHQQITNQSFIVGQQGANPSGETEEKPTVKK